MSSQQLCLPPETKIHCPPPGSVRKGFYACHTLIPHRTSLLSTRPGTAVGVSNQVVPFWFFLWVICMYCVSCLFLARGRRCPKPKTQCGFFFDRHQESGFCNYFSFSPIRSVAHFLIPQTKTTDSLYDFARAWLCRSFYPRYLNLILERKCFALVLLFLLPLPTIGSAASWAPTPAFSPAPKPPPPILC